jgi:outer membrane protein
MKTGDFFPENGDKMKRVTFALSVVGLISFFLCVSPSQADLKIGVVDIQKIMRESKAARNAQAVFMKEVEAKRAIMIAKEKEVWKLEEDFKNLGAKSSVEVRQGKAERLAKETRDLKRLGSDLEEELKKKNAELMQKLIGEIRQVLKTFSKKEDYTIILEKNTVLTADDAVDITDKILKLYDRQKEE